MRQDKDGDWIDGYARNGNHKWVPISNSLFINLALFGGAIVYRDGGECTARRWDILDGTGESLDAWSRSQPNRWMGVVG